jgi:tRNA A-37 threonylcarbamoyl transferase component Bud32
MSKFLDYKYIRNGFPDFRNLPWEIELNDWSHHSQELIDIPIGISRHPVLFLEVDEVLYALKELCPGDAKKEFEILSRIEKASLPVVQPVGFVNINAGQKARSVLITRYLEGSMPYRMLFMHPELEMYHRYLLDAVASLLVQLHLAGFYWGDCSLSNTLFRRDAGTLQAYLVDAETSEYFLNFIPPAMRVHDLQIMEESVTSELLEIFDKGYNPKFEPRIPLFKTGSYINLQYQKLWEQVMVDQVIGSDEHYLIQERVRALNDLGFSVGDIELEETGKGNQLKLHVVVTDRNFHSKQLFDLTGVEAEELQAQKMMNEIQELRAVYSLDANRHFSLEEVASYWLENIYHPVIDRLSDIKEQNTTLPELYCQILEHKWYLSEQAFLDVGHFTAVDDFINWLATGEK